MTENRISGLLDEGVLREERLCLGTLNGPMTWKKRLIQIGSGIFLVMIIGLFMLFLFSHPSLQK